ncbi:type II toxin-antitoxin system VapC family toxin [Paenibacillus sp. TRM 82003]|nr:type II toxin-antitoxin system VapC family toxin [Paenibacillus sp. TRM 82003]
MKDKTILDASVLLALLNEETGSERVYQAILTGAAISAVNASEVVGKLLDHGMAFAEVERLVGELPIEIVPFDERQALRCGALRTLTKSLGLSLGDRACLALAELWGCPVLTADRGWSEAPVAVPIEVIR